MKASVLLSVGCCSSSTKSEDVIKKAHATSIQPVQWPSQDFESRGVNSDKVIIIDCISIDAKYRYMALIGSGT